MRVHAVNPLRDLLHAKYQGRTGWNLQKVWVKLPNTMQGNFGVIRPRLSIIRSG